MLSAHDLRIGYHGRSVGDQINLVIRGGQALCVMGPNGCGKTTLFKTLLGLLPPLSGHVALDAQPITSLTRRQIARRVGYVPQAQLSAFPFTVIDIVLMGRASHVDVFSSPSGHDVDTASAALSSLGVRHLRDRRFTEISGGERQMVLIARALAQAPDLIVMDEPTASLDFGNQARVLEHIRTLTKAGLAVVFSTHDPGQAFACADDVIIMNSGQITAHGAPDAVVTAEALEQLYGVRVVVSDLQAADRKICVPLLGR